MSRPRANLQIRFADAVKMWDQIIDQNGSVATFETKNEAIRACFRLNAFRKAYRDTLTDEMPTSVYDRFKISHRGNQLVISPHTDIKTVSMEPLEAQIALVLDEC